MIVSFYNVLDGKTYTFSTKDILLIWTKPMRSADIEGLFLDNVEPYKKAVMKKMHYTHVLLRTSNGFYQIDLALIFEACKELIDLYAKEGV